MYQSKTFPETMLSLEKVINPNCEYQAIRVRRTCINHLIDKK